MWFSQLRGVNLAIGGSFADVERLFGFFFVGSADIQYASCIPPEETRSYLGLKIVKFPDVGIDSLDGGVLNGAQLLWPRMAVMPIGLLGCC